MYCHYRAPSLKILLQITPYGAVPERFLECGAPKDHPVFYFHGFSGSRLQACDIHETAKTDDE